MKWIFTILILLSAVFFSSSFATIINVPDDESTIQAGIYATSNGDTVLVQPDTYVETIDFSDMNITVASLYLTTQDTSYISQTVIDGNNGGTVVMFSGGEDTTAQLCGFTVTGGSLQPAGDDGYGIHCKSGSNPVITACRMDYNYPGGVYCTNSSPTFIGCTMSNNTDYGIYIYGESSPVISGCEITSNSFYGILVLHEVAIPTVTGCSIDLNGSYPIYAYANQIGSFSGNTCTGNVIPKIYVVGDTITDDATWENLGIPYEIAGDLYVQGTDGLDGITTLTLDSGVILRFSSHNRITIGHESDPNQPGALSAIGTESDTIVFTADSDTPSPGYWKNIYFATYADDTLSELAWCRVEYGGYLTGRSIDCNACSPRISHSEICFGSGVGVYCPANANPIITDCHIHNNASYGILVDDETAAPTVMDTDIDLNGSYPISAYANQIGSFSGNTCTGNVIPKIYVVGDTITDDATWENLGIPYEIAGDLYVQGTDGLDGITTLTLDSGVILRFSSHNRITIGHESDPNQPGALSAIGTESDTIVFTADSDTPTPGYWHGIDFEHYADNTLSELTYCIVEYGGYSSMETIRCEASSPTFNHTEIRYGSHRGISFSSGSNSTLTDCQIYDNYDEGLRCADSSPTISGCTFSENGSYGIYDYDGSTVIDSCTISGNSSHGVYCQTNSAVFSGCTISANGGDGIYMRSAGIDVVISGCQIYSNSSHGIYVYGVALGPNVGPTITGNSINLNGSYPVSAFAGQIGDFSDNTYTGNTIQKIEVRTDYVIAHRITNDATWEDPGIPYRIVDQVRIWGTDGIDGVTTLTLESGVILQFGFRVGIEVGSGSDPNQPGALSAIGTEFDRITFTADTVSPSPGSWTGICFYRYADDSLSELTWCKVEYGGYSYDANIRCLRSSPQIAHSEVCYSSEAGIHYINLTPGANPTITDCQIHDNTTFGVHCDDSSPIITGCTISANDSHGVYTEDTCKIEITGCQINSNLSCGIYMEATDSIPIVTGNSIDLNGSYPVSVPANHIAGVSSNTYTGNTHQKIEVRNGSIATDATWENPGIPYRISGNPYIGGTDGIDGVTTLTLNPGVILRFDDHKGITIGHGVPGALYAVGTETNRITFTSDIENPVPNDRWDDLYFGAYVDSLSELSWCILEYGVSHIQCYGGSPRITHSEIRNGARGFRCSLGSNPTVTDCQIYGHSYEGIECWDSSPVITRCAIYANDNYGYHVEGATSLPLVTNNTISQNQYGVYCEDNSAIVMNNCIVWGDSTQAIYTEAGCSVTATYSDIEGGWTGTGNLDTDPLFVDPVTSDFHLDSNSLCIDAGDPASPLDPDNTRADMGAFYYHQASSVPENVNDLTIMPDTSSVELFWSPVLVDTSGSPVDISYYVVYMSPVEPFFEPIAGDSIAAVIPPDTSFVDVNAYDDPKRFYNVTAITE